MAKRQLDTGEGITTTSPQGAAFGSLAGLQAEEWQSKIKHIRTLSEDQEAEALTRLSELRKLTTPEGDYLRAHFREVSADSILSSREVTRAGRKLYGIVFGYGRKFYFEPATENIFC